MTKEEVLEAIALSGDSGVKAKEMTAKMGSVGLWKILGELEDEGKIFKKKLGGVYHYIASDYKEESKMSKVSNELGEGLQNILLETIAKYSAEKVIDEVMPLIRKKCIEEFGMVPVEHKIKVGSEEPVSIKGELPPVFDKILKYARKKPVMMTGPAGTGKGHLARMVAKALKSEFFEVNAVQNEYSLTGFVDANSHFVETPFYRACKVASEGGNAVFLFDEMDCSNATALKIFNEALAAQEFTFPNNEKLEFPNLVILAACNTYGTGNDEQYVGERLDASTLNRFLFVKVDYNRKVELAIAKGDEELVDFIDGFRRATEKCGMLVVVSYRNLDMISCMRGDVPLRDVMKDALIKSMDEDDLQMVLNSMSESLKENPYFKATEGKNVPWPELETADSQLQLIA